MLTPERAIIDLLAAAEAVLGVDSDFWWRSFFWFKVAGGAISLLLIVWIVYLVVKLFGLSSFSEGWLDLVNLSATQKKRVLRAWSRILERVEKGDEDGRKLAIIEADRILDEILKLSGYKGETMAERLKQLTPANLSNIEQVWEAHKIRNRIVHGDDYKLSLQKTRELIEIYRSAFLELGLIRE